VTSLDPRAAAALLMVLEGMLLAGRLDDATVAFDHRTRPELGTVEVLSSAVPVGLGDLLRGELDDARRHLEMAVVAADACESRPAATAARALLAEVAIRSGDRVRAGELLDTLPSPCPGGMAAACVLRARAAFGDEGAMVALTAEARRLGAPVLTRQSG